MEYFKRVCANTRCLLLATGSKRWKVRLYRSNTDFRSFNLKPTILRWARRIFSSAADGQWNDRRASSCTAKVKHPTEETFSTKIYREKMAATSENLQVMNLLETGFFSSWNMFQIRGNTFLFFLNVHKMFPAHSVRLNHITIHPFIVLLQLEPSS